MERIKTLEAKDRIILALDVDTIEDVIKYVDLLKDYVGFFKVGLQLFTSCGFEAVKVIKDATPMRLRKRRWIARRKYI